MTKAKINALYELKLALQEYLKRVNAVLMYPSKTDLPADDVESLLDVVARAANLAIDSDRFKL